MCNDYVKAVIDAEAVKKQSAAATASGKPDPKVRR